MVLLCYFLSYSYQSILIYLILVVCSLPLCFLYCLAFCWATLVKLHTLWKTMTNIIKFSFIPSQVSFIVFSINQFPCVYSSQNLFLIILLYFLDAVCCVWLFWTSGWNLRKHVLMPIVWIEKNWMKFYCLKVVLSGRSSSLPTLLHWLQVEQWQRQHFHV